MSKYNILCFGDSNTFGFNPLTGGRYPQDKRYTGILQELLGSDYRIIESGLNGRTTVWEDPIRIHRAGKNELLQVIDTHKPIDLILIMLGTNDTKTFFNQTASNIAQGLEYLINLIQTYPWNNNYKKPDILVVVPPIISENALMNPFSDFDENSIAKSKKLIEYFKLIAEKRNELYFDSNLYTEVGIDGVHLNEEGHLKLAKALEKYIKQWSYNEIL